MLLTKHFYQLAPTPLGRLRNNYRAAVRNHLPCRLTFLADYDVSAETIARLRQVVATEDDERLFLVYFFMRLFDNESFRAYGALESWMRRRKLHRPDLSQAAEAFARQFARASGTELAGDSARLFEIGKPACQTVARSGLA